MGSRLRQRVKHGHTSRARIFETLQCSALRHLNAAEHMRTMDGMKRALAVEMSVAFALSGCANVHVNRATLVASTLSLAADWHSTTCFSDRMWAPVHVHEQNPLLGSRPSTGYVNGYFASVAVLNAIAWYVTPEKWRSVVPAAVAAVSVDRAMSNFRLAHDVGICGR